MLEGIHQTLVNLSCDGEEKLRSERQKYLLHFLYRFLSRYGEGLWREGGNLACQENEKDRDRKLSEYVCDSTEKLAKG